MKAVILAGGKGTRIEGVTKGIIPKPMIPVGGKPVLEHQINLLKKHGIKDIFIIIGHLSKKITEYFKNGRDYGVNISYFEEENPLGTAGGLKEIEKNLNETFILMYGDVMLNLDLARLISFHKAKKSDCTAVVHPNNHPFDSDLVELDGEKRMTGLHFKPHPEDITYNNLVIAALYVIEPKVLDYIGKSVKSYIGKDVLPQILEKLRVYGYNTPEYLKDMGTPERLKEVEKAWTKGIIQSTSLENKRPAIFMDRDGVINEDIDLIHTPEQMKIFDYSGSALKKINESQYLSVLATNQSVVARGLCSIKDVEDIHKKMETELGSQGAYLDAIYYCPHHPDKGYPEENPEYKVECSCRKPKPGMLIQASEDLNIDLEKSWMIGDSQSDIEAGKAAGCKTIMVQSGRGWQENKPDGAKADYEFPSLKEAVEFILSK